MLVLKINEHLQIKIKSASVTNPVRQWYKVMWWDPRSISLLFPRYTSTSPSPSPSAHAWSLQTRSASGYQRSLFLLLRTEHFLAGLCVPDWCRTPSWIPGTSTSHSERTEGRIRRECWSSPLLTLSGLPLWSQCTGHLQPRTKNKPRFIWIPKH